MQNNAPVDLLQEVVIILAAGFAKNGHPCRATVMRAEAGVELVRAHPNTTVILSGGRKEARHAKVHKTDAEVMAAIFEHEGIPSSQVLLEQESRDLLGQAVLSCARYLSGASPRKLYLITSPEQAEHALAVFRHVLPLGWEVQPVVTLVPEDEDEAPSEESRKQSEIAFFDGITPGDYQQMLARLRASAPHYAKLA
jgi:uncharacterized SAM-binding protein YcdF (DUF218 family)